MGARMTGCLIASRSVSRVLKGMGSPCRIVSVRTTGELTTATFRLSDRPGGDCGSGAGGSASTTFDIEDGKIVEWRRVDDAPAPGSGDGEGTEV